MRLWPGRTDRDFSDEIEAHLASETDRLIRLGVAPADAAAQARRAFGNVTATRERFHLRGPRVLLEQAQQDLRYAGRSLRRSPGFAAIAVLCLAVGISVNTAAFSVLNALLFRDFPGVVAQHELATILIGEETKWGRSGASFAAYPDWEEFRSGLSAFSGIAAFGSANISARATREPEAVRGDFVSPGFFELLGTRPAAGRFFSPTDDSGTETHTVVLSHKYWERAFDGRTDFAAMHLTVGTQAFDVIGVAPEGFVGLYPGELLDSDIGSPELYVPLAAAPLVRAGSAQTNVTAQLDDRWLRIVGRVGRAASIDEARAQAEGVAARIATRYPTQRKGAYTTLFTGGAATAKADEQFIGVLSVMAVPVILLLVACANLANQLLARAVERRREIAVRLSLGATRGRVIRQLLIEAGALAVAASVIALLFARGILDAIRAFFLAIPFRIPFDGHVFVFTVCIAAATSVVFGLVPAFRATRVELAGALKDRSSGSGFRKSRLQSALIVVQIAASLALIAMSGVFVRAAEPKAFGVQSKDAGSTAVIALDLDLLGLSADAGRAYQAALLDRAGAVPSVAAVAIAPFSPVQQPNPLDMRDLSRPDGTASDADVARVSGNWFGLSDALPLAGRMLTAAELSGPPVVAVVDAVFASRWWHDSTAVGRSLVVGTGSDATTVTIVGVIDTIWDGAFRQPEGRMILPRGSTFDPRTYLYVRTRGPVEPLFGALRSAVTSLDPRMPVLWMRTLEDLSARDNAPMASLASGIRALGGVALALAALGLFGVMSFVVAQRRREIGIRVALGAQRNAVTWMVLRQALRLGAAGALAGTGIAIATAIVLRSLIHGMPSLEPASVAIAAAVMCVVAMVASAVPAQRAAGVDPNVALRDDA